LSQVDPKRVYYLSLEFLLGRSMDNALLNMGLKGTYGSKFYFVLFTKKVGISVCCLSGFEYAQCK
jgi:glucan phosphorylase